MLVLITCGQDVSSALKGTLATVVAMVWSVWKEPAPVFAYGCVVCKGTCQSGHVGHGIEHQVHEEPFGPRAYCWAENLAFSP